MILDLSYHKGNLNVQEMAAAGVKANIHKAADGFFMPTDVKGNYAFPQHIDVTFRDHWAEFKQLLDWRGAYLFLRVDDEVALQKGRPTSLEQVDIFTNELFIQGLEDDDYVILDVEQAADQIEYLSKETIGDRVKDAVLKTESIVGRKPIIYTGAWWWEMYHQGFDNDFFQDYPFWLSLYWDIGSDNKILYSGNVYYEKPNRVFPREWRGPDKLNSRIAYVRVPMLDGVPTINPDMVFLWQYSDKAKVPGTNDKNLDINLEIIPEEEWVVARKGDGKPKPPTPVDVPTLNIPGSSTLFAVQVLIQSANSKNWSPEKVNRMIFAAGTLH